MPVYARGSIPETIDRGRRDRAGRLDRADLAANSNANTIPEVRSSSDCETRGPMCDARLSSLKTRHAIGINSKFARREVSKVGENSECRDTRFAELQPSSNDCSYAP